MLTPDQINTIHHLHFVEKWPQRKIAKQMKIGRRTLAKYIRNPAPAVTRRARASKVDPFKPAIAELLERDAAAPAAAIYDRIRTLGYDGGITIVRDYIHAVRAETTARRAYVRMEPGPGERCDVDWGTSAPWLITARRASSMPSAWSSATADACMSSSPHRQSFETLVRCHIHAFEDMGGCSREIWFDFGLTRFAGAGVWHAFHTYVPFQCF